MMFVLLPQVCFLGAGMGSAGVVPGWWAETPKEAGASHQGDGGGIQTKMEGDWCPAHQTRCRGQGQEEAEGKNGEEYSSVEVGDWSR